MDSSSSTQDPVNHPHVPLHNGRAPREDLRSRRRGRGGQTSRGSAPRDGAGGGRGRGRGHNPRMSDTKAVDMTIAGSAPEGYVPADQPVSQTKTNGTSHTAEELVDDVETEVCFICASPVVHNSIAPCNHRTCHICALRLRALYKTKACAHCRTSAEYVIFTDDAEKRYEDFSLQDFANSDHSLGIQYEKNDIFEDTVLLLRYNCPDSDCDIACYGWPDLHRHVRNVHRKIMCDLCTRNKKVFTHEHELFTYAELRKHEKFGDDHPGAIDQSGFKGHPECGFCQERFYGDDELYTHCRDKHERCHICDRRSSNRKQQYYRDYDGLEVHFKKDHFLCPDSECLEKKFVVFESEMDMKAHQLESHPHGLSKDERRDARRVDMSGFDLRAPHVGQRGGRREGRGRGRGRDPNVDQVTQFPSAQHLRRDEPAERPSLAIHSAQSVSNRTFGGQLTTASAFTARAPAMTIQPPTVTAPGAHDAIALSTNSNLPSLETLNLNGGNTSVNISGADRARQLRHASVIERAANLVGNDQERLGSFRTNISSYRNSAMTAAQLIDFFFTIFDTDSASIGTLVKELADIFEISSKKDDLLKAWNDWRAINEDYPSLPGPNGGLAGGPSASGAGGKRILKLKSSTVQSSRSAVSRQSSWGTANGPTSSSSSFPPISGAAGRGNTQNKPAWLMPASSSVSSSARPSPAPSRPNSTRPPPTTTTRPTTGLDAFPALPAGQKPGMNVTRPGYVGTPRLREGRSGSSTPANAWSTGGLGGNLSSAIEAALKADDEENAGKGKGKGKKKVQVMRWG